jgi:putative glutamine amidotransferase
MFSHSVFERALANCSISIGLDAASAPTPVIRVEFPGNGRNAEVLDHFASFLSARFYVGREQDAEGRQRLELTPPPFAGPEGAEDTALPRNLMRDFVQMLSGYYGVSAEALCARCSHTDMHGPLLALCRADDLAQKIHITDAPGTSDLMVTIADCEKRTPFCKWLGNLYETDMLADTAEETVLRLKKSAYSRIALTDAQHLVGLCQAIQSAWDVGDEDIGAMIQPETARDFTLRMLKLRPHPTVADDVREGFYKQEIIQVGAGFTGTATLVQYLRKLNANPEAGPVRVTVYERNPHFLAGGLAYGAAGNEHHVNVEAQYLSLDPDNKHDFVDWLRQARHSGWYGEESSLNVPMDLTIPTGEVESAAVQRRLYQYYLSQRLTEEMTRAANLGVADVRFEFDEVTAAARTAQGFSVTFGSGETRNATHLVLTTGHGPTKPLPFLRDGAALAPDQVIIDQWFQKDRLQTLLDDDSVRHLTVIGSGLSAMDVVKSAAEAGFFFNPESSITLVSRGGHLHPVLDLSQKYAEPVIDIDRLAIPQTVEDVPAFVTTLFAGLKEQGLATIGREHTNEEIFFSMTARADDFFARTTVRPNELMGLLKKHSSLITTTAVSMAPEIGNVVMGLIGQGRVRVLSSEPVAVEKDENGLSLVMKDGSRLFTNGIVSTTPPQSDPTSVPVFSSLLQQGTVRKEDETGLGLDMDLGTYRPIDANGNPVDRLFVAGPIVSGEVMKHGRVGPLYQIIGGLRHPAQRIAGQLMADAEITPRPRVAIIANLEEDGTRSLCSRWQELLTTYGLDVVLVNPDMLDKEAAGRLAASVNGVLLPGGNSNLHSSLYGQEPIDGQFFDPRRDAIDLALIEACRDSDIPLLGICRDAHAINVAYEGSMNQSIGNGHDYGYLHSERKADKAHPMICEAGGLFAALYPDAMRFDVNSIHRQGIPRGLLGAGLRLEATDGNGVVEAFSDPAKRFLVGVQYHPEFGAQRTAKPQAHGRLRA